MKRGSAALKQASEGIHAVEIDDEMLPTLSLAVHRQLQRCGGYVQHVKRVLPAMVEGLRYEWVFVLFDDVDATSLQLEVLLRIARFNQLSWASPAVDGAHDEVAAQRPGSITG